MDKQNLLSVIDLAIKKEDEARQFYLELLGKIEDKSARDTLKYLADEEAGHAKFLSECRTGRYCSTVLKLDDVIDYRIVEHLKQPDIKKDMNSADVFLIAAKREQDSHNFYKALAESYPQGDLKDLLERMAKEEMRHKEKMEYLYANTAFPQTDGG